MATSVWVLSEAELGLGKLGLARQHLQEMLVVMVKSKTRLMINAERALLTWAQLLLKECGLQDVSNSGLRVQQNQAYALELLTNIIHEPEGQRFFKARAAKLAAMTEGLLPADLATSVKDRGRSKPMRQMISELTREQPNHA